MIAAAELADALRRQTITLAHNDLSGTVHPDTARRWLLSHLDDRPYGRVESAYRDLRHAVATGHGVDAAARALVPAWHRPSTVPDVLTAAADLLTGRWCQYDRVTSTLGTDGCYYDAAYDVVGAIHAVLTGDAEADPDEEYPAGRNVQLVQLARVAQLAVVEALARSGAIPGPGVGLDPAEVLVEWDDAAGRTAAQVVAALRATAVQYGRTMAGAA
jgi:hypothetical protein